MYLLLFAGSSALAGPPPLAEGGGPLVEIGSFVKSGSGEHNGHDEALGVAVQENGNVVAVGYLDGPADHGTDAYVVVLRLDNVLHEYTWDSGPVSATRLDSDDRLEAVVVGADDALTFCGRRGGTGLNGEPSGLHWVIATTPDRQLGLTERWSWTLQDGPGSGEQACHGLTHTGTEIVTIGSSSRLDTGGRWWMHRFDLGSHPPTDPDEFGFADGHPSASERPFSVAADPNGGGVVVAGQRSDPVTGDLDPHIRYYEADNQLRWQASYGSPAYHDRARGVVFAPTGDPVVSYIETNGEGVFDRTGTFTWLSAAGDGKGGAVEIHTLHHNPFETVLALRSDCVLGAGPNWDEPANGNWGMVASRSANPAVLPCSEPSGYRGGTAGAVRAIDVKNGRVALAGYIIGDDGTRDFAVTVLEGDFDEDGLANSLDGCPANPVLQEPGVCGCIAADHLDGDGDGTPDCIDHCADDPFKAQSVGVCGCGVPDVDTDRDGLLDCQDACPADRDKVELGVCGCGVADEDLDEDDRMDCHDACLNTPPEAVVDDDGCSEDEGSAGCGCASTGGGRGGYGGAFLLGVIAASGLRRPRIRCRRSRSTRGGGCPAPRKCGQELLSSIATLLRQR